MEENRISDTDKIQDLPGEKNLNSDKPELNKPDQKNKHKKYLVGGVICLVVVIILGGFGYKMVAEKINQRNEEVYLEARKLSNDEEYAEAYELYKKIPGFKDSKERAEICHTAVLVEKSEAWKKLKKLTVNNETMGYTQPELEYKPAARTISITYPCTVFRASGDLINKLKATGNTDSLERSYTRHIDNIYGAMQTPLSEISNIIEDDDSLKGLDLTTKVRVLDVKGEVVFSFTNGKLIGGSGVEYLSK